MAKSISKTRAKGPVHLRFDSGKVIVTAEDQDRFVLAAQQAVEGCQWVSRRDHLLETFSEEFLTPIYNWCVSHKDKISACYVAPPRGATLMVFIIGKSDRYDFSLSNSISKLELELDDKKWSADVLQLPASDTEELRSFFKPEGALQVYAQT